MKAVLQKQVFKPIDLTLTIETEEEFNQILLMSHYQLSISDFLRKTDKRIERNTIENILHAIFNALNKQ